MSGALAERVFVTKLERVGLVDVRTTDRFPFGIDRAAEYPLFTPDLIELMRRLIPAEHHDQVATSVIITANKPAAA